MIELLVVAIGGGVGAAARFVVDGEVGARHTGGFPWGTFVVNVTGSLLIGVLSSLFFTLFLTSDQADQADHATATLQLALTVGLCGGFTTFSTTTVESVRLARSGRMHLALASSLGTLVITVAAVGLGMAVGTAVGEAIGGLPG